MPMQQEAQPQLQPTRQLVDMQLSLSTFPDLAFLAKGAMCKCFIARRCRQSPSLVVLKMSIENGPKEAERDLNTELSMLQNLSHPNLARLFGAGKTPKGKTFIVVEYLEGGTLRSKLDAAAGGLGFWAACKHALELASVMRYMHEEAIPGRCILHRDLKPDNLAFTGTRMKLFDLGLAKVIRRSNDGANDVYQMTGEVGSLRYMAPEVARQRPYNEKVDVHSFGFILWEMVTGWQPFSGLSPDMFMTQVVQLGHRPMLQCRWNPIFKSLLASCWAELPRDRPSFSQIHDALEALLSDRDVTTFGRMRWRQSGEDSESHLDASASSTSGQQSKRGGMFSRLLGGRRAPGLRQHS